MRVKVIKKIYIVTAAIFLMSFILNKDKIQQNTIKIGKQEWMAKNLCVEVFRNGDSIKEVRSSEEWESAIDNKIPAWCSYDNKKVNNEKYGKIYNFYAVIDPRGLAPEGFRIPLVEDWEELVNFLGKDHAWGSLIDKEGWLPGIKNTTNSSGFRVLAGGSRGYSGYFDDITTGIIFWSAPTSDDANINNNTTSIVLSIWNPNVIEYRYGTEKNGMYVRCIKEKYNK